MPGGEILSGHLTLLKEGQQLLALFWSPSVVNRHIC